MTFRCTTLIALLAVSFDASPGLSAEPSQFTPVAAWTADFADNSCALRRYFQHGDTDIFLEFRKYAPGAQMEVTIASDSLIVRPKKPEMRFLPDPQAEVQDFYLTIDGGNGWKALQFWDSLNPNAAERRNFGTGKALEEPDAARKAAISAYEVKNVFEHDIELMTGPMEKADAVMEKCVDDLVASWGVDPAVQKTLTRRIQWTGNEEWLKRLGGVQADLLRNKSIGQIHLRAVIDEQGRVADCVVTEFPKPGDETAAKLCGALDHAQFDPALDANSRPVKSFIMLPLGAVRRVEFTSSLPL